MRNLVGEYVSQFRQNRQKQIKLAAILAALAVIVAGVVFWQLHNTGVAMTNEVFCGQEEHVHSEDCYDGDTLTCEIPEHTHTVECLIDESADLETADDWEATLPEDLSGVWSEDVAAIAESQVGYTESERNFKLAEDGETIQGYTRYGAWYGNAYGDWDAMFAAFCLNYAGISEEYVPFNSGAYAWAVDLSDSGLYVESDGFTPCVGDLIFLDTDADETADRVGIVTTVEEKFEVPVYETNNEEAEAITVLTVVEGDSDNAVAENEYELDDEMIVAYGILPEQPEDENAEEITDTGIKAGISGQSGTTEISESEINENESVDTDEKETAAGTALTYEGTDYTVTVSYGAAAELPDDTELVVSEYLKDTPGYLARCAEIGDLYGWKDENNISARLFQISLYSDGTEVEPEAEVQVEVSYLDCEEKADTGYTVVHFSNDITDTIVSFTDYEDGAKIITFSVSSFSDFMVIENDDYGISSLAWSAGDGKWYSDNDHFKFINTDDALSSHHDSGAFEPDSGVDYIKDGENYFHIIDEDTNPVSTKNKFTLNATTLDQTSLPDGITFVWDEDDGKWLLLLDISSISTNEVTGNPDLTVLYDNLAEWGYTFTEVGTIRFNNAGTVAGDIPVDVKVTFDSIQLYNHYAQRQINAGYTDPQLPKDQLYTFANIDSSDLWISQNYTSDYKAAWEGGYSYPCDMDVNLTIEVVLHNTEDVVDMSFLMVASDLDGYRTSNWGSGAETFKTLSGFNGNYYIYPTDADNIASLVYSSNGSGDSITGKGVATAQAYNPSSEDYRGDDGYKLGGIYADTQSGEFSVGYSEVWCGTRVELYDLTTNDITIQKVEYNENAEDEEENVFLDGAGFILYKDVYAGDPDYPYDIEDEDNYGKHDPVRIYYESEKKSGEEVIAAIWTTDREKANVFYTETTYDEYNNVVSTGEVTIKCLYPSALHEVDDKENPGEKIEVVDPYFLEEITAPDGYNLLTEPIKFQLTTYGTAILLKDNPDYPDNSSNPYITDSDDPYVNVVNHPVDDTDSEDRIIFTVSDTSTSLPNTGGTGTWIFTVLGVCLFGGASAALVYRKRKAVRS